MGLRAEPSHLLQGGTQVAMGAAQEGATREVWNQEALVGELPVHFYKAFPGHSPRSSAETALYTNQTDGAESLGVPALGAPPAPAPYWPSWSEQGPAHQR